MAQINKPGLHFNTKLYTGTHSSGGAQSITGVGFQPDWVWLKNRTSNGYDQRAYDAVRGVTKLMNINLTNAEGTDAQGLTAFGTDGFTVGTSNGDNNNGDNYVSWNWKGNGAGSSNSDGTIASTVSVNTTAGFSIVAFTGNSGTVGHGLGVKPDFIVVKSRQTAGSNNWVITHSALGTNMNDNYIVWNTTGAAGSSSNTWGGEPTTTTFTVSSGVAANDNNIAYCFTKKPGFSKFGKYTGNGADGSTTNNFIYTGFKPAWVMVKRYNDTGQQWSICDSVRSPTNVSNSMEWLFPDSNGVETDEDLPFLLSNGFMPRTGHTYMNRSGFQYLYMAFAENPLVGTNNIPAVAR